MNLLTNSLLSACRAIVCVSAAVFAASSLAQGGATQVVDEVEALRFDLLEIEVHGNSVLSARDIEGAVTPFVGPRKLMADVEAARVALEKLYQDRGYLTVLVDVPEQRVEGGVVMLQVTEGRVERLAVTGSRYFSQGYIRSKVPELAEGRVPNFNQVQVELAQVNRTAERRVQPVLKPGIEPGTVQVDLKVDDRLPLAANIEVNNLHAPDTETWRVSAGLRYDNLWQRDHSLAVNTIISPEDTSQVRVLSANYTIPFGADGTTWLLYAVRSESNVVTLGGTSVLGNGTTIGTRYVWPISNTPAGFHTLSVGADYKDLTEDVQFGGDTIETPLRYLPFQFGYSGTWFGEGGPTSLNATLSVAGRSILQRNVDCPGNVGQVDQFACKRQGADGGFAWLRLDGRHSLKLPGVVPGALGMRLALQVANEPLASAEQFQIGGADTVRGYLEGSASGDRGAFASFEWRSPNWAGDMNQRLGGAKDMPLSELALLAFVEGGEVQLTNALPGQAARERLGSFGVGLRASGALGWQLSLDIADPQTQPSSARSKKTRAHVRFGWRL